MPRHDPDDWIERHAGLVFLIMVVAVGLFGAGFHWLGAGW